MRAMRMPGTRSGLLGLALGAAIAVGSQLAAPIAVPLYDGVTPAEPYRYLQPGQGQTGSPSSFTAEPLVAEGQSPEIIAATTESPPQAQLIALPGTFEVGSATTLRVEIAAVAPPALAAPGAITGNVYRVTVTDSDGSPRPVATAHKPTVVMRSPGSVANGAIARFADGRWETLPSEHQSALGFYSVEPDALGDFAIVDLAVATTSPTEIALVVTGVVLGAALIGLLIRFVIRRGGSRPPPPDEPRRRVPSKRRAPPPPPRPAPPASATRRDPRTGRPR
jgi:hypothetical protein